MRMTNETAHKRMRMLAGVGLIASILAGCGTVSDVASNVNPFSREEKLEGDRSPVFEGADPAMVAQGRVASIGSASGGQTWQTAGGGVTNNPGNVAVSVSGARAWRASIGSTGGRLSSASVRPSARPVSDGSRIYVYKPGGEVVALSAGGGRIWSKSLRPEGESDVAPGGGVAVADGRVYAATGYRQVAALDSASGQVLWTAEIDTPARGAPAVGGGHVFVVSQSNEVYALSQTDGTQAWSYAGIEETAGLLSGANPAVSGGRVIVPFSSGEIMAIDIKKGEPVWIDGVSRGFRTLALSGLADVSASPVVDGKTVYATGVAGRTVAVSATNGQRLWEQDLGSVHTPVVSGNALFMVDLDDRMVALELKTGETLWSTSLPRPERKKRRRNWAGPVLANGALIAFSSDGQIAMVDAASGNLMLTQKTSSNVFVTPIVASGRVVVLDGDDAVAAYN